MKVTSRSTRGVGVKGLTLLFLFVVGCLLVYHFHWMLNFSRRIQRHDMARVAHDVNPGNGRRRQPRRSSSWPVGRTSLKPVSGLSDDTKDELIHVALSTDKRTFPGLLAAMRSTIVNTNEPEALRFYLIAAPDEVDIMFEAVECLLTNYKNPTKGNVSLGSSIHSYVIIPFNILDYDPDWKIAYRESADNTDRSAPNNYVRLYVHRMLRDPNVVGYPIPNKIVYLDTDVIVQGDVAQLYRSALTNNTYSVAMSKRSLPLSKYTIQFGHPELIKWNREHKGTEKEIKKTWPAYNNGISVMHLRRWEDQNVSANIKHWINANIEKRLYKYGFNPPFLLGLFNQVEELHPSWNIDGLGYLKKMPKRKLSNAKILHWTGPGKGWNEHGLYQQYWSPYNATTCLEGRI